MISSLIDDQQAKQFHHHQNHFCRVNRGPSFLNILLIFQDGHRQQTLVCAAALVLNAEYRKCQVIQKQGKQKYHLHL